MRVLDFGWFPGGALSEAAKSSYEILYDGLLNSTRGLEAPSETRVVSRIQDKLEAIGETAERGGLATFTLRQVNDAPTVSLEETEYKLLGECLRSVRWMARAAKQVTVAMDFFNGAAQVE